jgi:hypothetical protein
MYEHNKLTASAGRSGLVCSAQGGSATSKGVCAGFTEDMCLKLQSDFDVDTEWNPEAGGCIMQDSQKNAHRQKTAQISGSVGMFILGVVTLPVSGGASGVFIAAAIGSSLVLISTVTSGTINAVIDQKFTTALMAANSCLINQCGGTITKKTTCDTCPNKGTITRMDVVNKTSADCISCATTSVRDIIETVITYNGDFAVSNANASAYMIDVLYSVINGTLQPICLEKVATGIETSPWMTIKDISDTARKKVRSSILCLILCRPIRDQSLKMLLSLHFSLKREISVLSRFRISILLPERFQPVCFILGLIPTQ